MISTQDFLKRLDEQGCSLPEVAAPAANYVPYVVSNNVVYISGQLPFLNGVQSHIGRLGDTIEIAGGQQAAQNCALNILAQLNQAIDGEWQRLDRCLKLGGFVNSTMNFTDQPSVINGASDLLGSILGEQGRHARFAVSANSLPFGVAVEIDATFALKA